MNEISFWNWVELSPQRTAVIGPDKQSYTFLELSERVNQLSHGLYDLGLRRGDAIAVVVPNGIEWLEIFLATLQSGLYMVTINNKLTGKELAYILENSEASHLIAHERFAGAVGKAVEQLGYDLNCCYSIGNIEGFHPFENLKTSFSVDLPEERSAGTMMLYTSGTTGEPKGVRRQLPEDSPETVGTKASFLCLLFNGTIGEGSHLVMGPTYHSGPSGFGTAALHAGQTMIIMDKWTPEEALSLIDEHKITATHCVPTHFERMLNLPEEVKDSFDVSSITHVVHAAAPCAVGTKQRMIDWWGPVINELYGATEGGGTYSSAQEWMDKPGTVGKPWPGSDVKIYHDDGSELAANEPGLIYMSTAAGKFEYHKDKEKTESNRRDGLFTTGDVGYLDDDGFLFICDRESDMLISGGVNIYPAEIEGVILQHPKVKDVAVFGVPHPDWGEAVKAVVETTAGVEGNEQLTEELTAFIADSLAKYKWPKSFEYVEELPRTETGKLSKRDLRDQYWSDMDVNV